MLNARSMALYGRFAMMICMSSLAWAAPGATQAQPEPAGEVRPSRAIRQSTIQESELSGDDSEGAAARPLETPSGKVETRRDDRSGTGSKFDGAEPAEMEDETPQGRDTDELPLLARITPKTAPQRAASLKLIDEGRKALQAGEYKQALGTFERAISVDATNPYSHYFVARAHFFLGNHRESFNFLDVAESLLGWHRRWLAEIYVLKGRNATAMGFLGRADTDFLKALGFDPYNSFAMKSLTTISTPAERARSVP